MSIKSIRIKNILSFKDTIINNFEEINCIVGKNNVGKSNLLKTIRFFYDKLEGKRILPPELNSKYSNFGTITITYDLTRIHQIVTSETNINKSNFFKHIYNTFFKNESDALEVIKHIKNTYYLELTLKINSNDSTEWLIKEKKLLTIVNYLFPFFDIETRHIDLYDWDKLWIIVSKLKSFNVNKIDQKEIINFFDKEISSESNSYKDYVNKIQNITGTSKYNYREKVLNYVKAGLKGQTFLIDDKSLDIQSDGTNSHRFIEIALELLISLSRREYISPIIYIDEPEIGLHPKKNEDLIYKLYKVYDNYKKTKKDKEKGKYKTPYPIIILATHSPHIVKETIKLFDKNQQVLHFSKNKQDFTLIQKMNSIYDDKRFLNIFNDNEARLFFSDFILFVEGATELEIFSNRKLIEKFNFLNKIDIYQTNELVLKYINPSYLNTSIPYLVLYDADKLISIDINTKKLTFKNKDDINFLRYIKLYKNAYRGSKQKLIYDFLIQLVSWQKNLNLLLDKNLYISNFNYELLIQYINDNFLKQENFRLNKTTIEEVLINKDSFPLFKKWLFIEFKVSIESSYNSKTPQCQINRIKNNKAKEYIKYRRFIKNLHFQEKDIRTIFILIFGGKTETTIATFTDNKNHLEEPFSMAIKKIKKGFIEQKKALNLGHLIGKTSGWTTSFLDFSINYIENNKGDQKFEDEFKKIFRELYDIIKIVKEKL